MKFMQKNLFIKIAVVIFSLTVLSFTRVSAAVDCGTINIRYNPNPPFNIIKNFYICADDEEPSFESQMATAAIPYCTGLKCPNNPPCPDPDKTSCKVDLSSGSISGPSIGIKQIRVDTNTKECGKKKKYIYHAEFRQVLNIKCPCKCCPIKTKRGNRSKQCKLGEICDTCDAPDLVDLDEFTATPQKDGISLTWTTKSELDSQGFRVWRGTPDLGKYCGCSDNMDDYKQITMTTLDEKGNPTLIPATGSTTSGSNYAYLDKDVKPGIPYCYALEDIDSKGKSKFYYEYITFTPDAELEQSTQ
jgi:hypothetical protein